MSIDSKENNVDTEILRLELKKWENAFRQANGGQKPGRADIKKDATIGAKYKLYEQLSNRNTEPAPKLTPKKSTRHSNPHDAPRDKARSNISSTPRKTPSKGKAQQPLHPPVLSPVQEVEATPAFIRSALGPTPQKDGTVLGIFDIASATPAKGVEDTPNANRTVIAGTPSKAAPGSSDQPFSKSPQSASKRFFLDAFAGTPLKRKRGEDDVGTTSSSKRKFATPAFLRRSFPLASIDEESTTTGSTAPPFRKRGLVRSLSSIIQGLKKQEEESMDDEWDVMREMEEEEEEEEESGEKKEKKKEPPKVMVEDSQAAEMPLGPDMAPESEVEDSGAEGHEKTRKPWKKKGLKRQTRRVIMRPVTHKAKKADDAGEAEESEIEVVEETQLDGAPPRKAGDEDEFDGSGIDEDEVEKAKSTKAGKKKQPASKKSTAKEKEKDDGKAAKSRKVNPDAHANYRALKIKNKNSKANGRGGRRFGRR